MLAKDIMTAAVVSISDDATVEEAVRLMLVHHVSALPVVDAKGGLAGLISEGDLMRRVREPGDVRRSWWLEIFAGANESAQDFVKLRSQRVADVMTRDVISVEEDVPVGQIAQLLEKHRIKRVPVLRAGLVVGIVSRSNLLHALYRAEQSGLTVSSEDDRDVRARIDAALKEVPLVASNLVNYTVDLGEVTMLGLVESEIEANAIRVAVENVRGVRGVNMQMGHLPAWINYGI